MMETFGERLVNAVRAHGPVAVGLDPHLERLPASLRRTFDGLRGPEWRVAAAQAVAEFDAVVLGLLAGRVAAVKPQFAFYEQLGAPGWAALERTCAAARAAGLLVIGDGKRGDIASTAAAYAASAFDPEGPLVLDALTVNPWMGFDTLTPFLARCEDGGSGLFVLVRTTNAGSADLQRHGHPSGAMRVADAVHRAGLELVGESGLSSIGAVVGAQVPHEEVRELRRRMPDAWFLVPGVGAQGATPAEGLAGVRADGLGSLVVAARSVLFPAAPDPNYDRDFEAWISARVSAFAASVRAAWLR